MLPIHLALIEEFLLEDPLPLGLSLIVVAAVMGFLSWQQKSVQLRSACVFTLLLALLVFVTASLVTTTREQVMERTQELIGHTAPLQLDRFKAMVSPQVVVTVGEEAGADTYKGGEVFTKLETALRTWPIDQQTVSGITAQSRGEDVVLCQLDIRSDSKSGRVMTRWILTWRKQADDAWLVTDVQWIDCPGLIGIKPSSQWLR